MLSATVPEKSTAFCGTKPILRAQVLLRHLAHVHAVHQHAAAVDVVEARDQADQRRLARAGAADDRRDLARVAR